MARYIQALTSSERSKYVSCNFIICRFHFVFNLWENIYRSLMCHSFLLLNVN